MIDIKDTSEKIIFSTPVNKGCKRKFELMKDDYITLKFSLLSPITFKLGYYTICDFGRFEIVDEQNPTFNTSTGGYDYELKFEAYYMKWKNKIFKYTPETGGNEASWSLTAQLSEHLDILLRNLKVWGYQYEGMDFVYEIDSDVNVDALFITYSNTNLIDGLTAMAEAAGCEWWVEGNTIRFGRCENGEPVEISLEENAKTMSLSKSSGDYFTRVFAFGSDRNIGGRYRKKLEFTANSVNGYIIKDKLKPVNPAFFRDGLMTYDEFGIDPISESGDLSSDSKEIIVDIFHSIVKQVPYNIIVTGDVSIDLSDFARLEPTFNITIGVVSGNIIKYEFIQGAYSSYSFTPRENDYIFHINFNGNFYGIINDNIPEYNKLFLVKIDGPGYIGTFYRYDISVSFKATSQFGKINTFLNLTDGTSYPVTINPSCSSYSSDEAGEILLESQIKQDTKFTLDGIVKTKVPLGYFDSDVDGLTVNGVVQRRLMLPEGTPYIDVYPNMSDDEVIEGIVTFDYVYPRKTLTIDAVEEEMVDQTEDDKPTGIKVPVYRIKTTGLVGFEETYVIGNELTLTFQAGNETGKLGDKLAGLSFGLTFLKDKSNESETWFQVVPNEDYGGRLPDTIMKPSVGDKFVMAGYDTEYMFDNLIPEAEQELKSEAEKYAEKIRNNIGTLSAPLYSDWSKSYIENKDILHPFNVGQKVTVNNPAIFETPRTMRVIGYEVNLDIPWDSPSYTIGESTSYSRLGALEDKIDSVSLNGSKYLAGKVSSNGTTKIYIIKKNDNTPASDNNVFSALRAISTFLRKDKEESMPYLLSLLSGANFGNNAASIDINGIAEFLSLIIRNNITTDNFYSGIPGSGFSLMKRNSSGHSYLEVDDLYIRMKAVFDSLEIREVKFVGGTFVASPGGHQLKRVETITDTVIKDSTDDILFDYEGSVITENLEPNQISFYRCYFTCDDGEKEIYNAFQVGDFALCKSFNIKEGGKYENISNSYYWREVIGVGEDYIDLSDDSKDPQSTEPSAGDSVVVFGNKNDVERKNAIVIAAFGDNSPYFVQYKGIDTFEIKEDNIVTYLSPSKNKITGELHVSSGENIETILDVLNGSIKSQVESITSLTSKVSTIEQTSNSIALKVDSIWPDNIFPGGDFSNGVLAKINPVYVDPVLSDISDSSVVTKALRISTNSENSYFYIGEGQMPVNPGEVYTIIFRTFCSLDFVNNGCGAYFSNSEGLDLVSFTEFNVPYDSSWAFHGFKVVVPEGSKYLVLRLGTINKSSVDVFYTDIMVFKGNLINSIPNYFIKGKNDDLLPTGIDIYNKKILVTADSFEIKNNEGNTVAVFQGKDNPKLRTELIDVETLFVKHLDGATGEFKGTLKIGENKIVFNSDGSGLLAGGNLYWDVYGNLHSKSPIIKEWVDISEYEDHIVDFSKGSYLFLAVDSFDSEPYELSVTENNIKEIVLKCRVFSRSYKCATLSGNFYLNYGLGEITANRLTLGHNALNYGVEISISYSNNRWELNPYNLIGLTTSSDGSGSADINLWNA